MVKETKDEREREVDSFLRSAQESHRKPKYPDWEMKPPREDRRRGSIGVVLVVCLIVLVLILFFAVKELKGIKIGSGGDDSASKGGGLFGTTTTDNLKIDQGKYQAVFLSNGQVYFGKIANHEGNYVELDDIYYLQVKPVLQQGDNSNSNDNKNPQEQKTEISLVKLGNELHGPLDRMMINRDQVVFIEDLKDDSKVTDAIHRYQQGQK
jgi:hypothetical protein